MTHTVREKDKLLSRVRRIKGQVDAIERALIHETGCEKVMHLLASTRAAMSGLMAEVIVRVGEHELVSVITRSSAERMGLREGSKVSAVIKSTEVMLATL